VLVNTNAYNHVTEIWSLNIRCQKDNISHIHIILEHAYINPTIQDTCITITTFCYFDAGSNN